LKGKHLFRDKYDGLLQAYYDRRGWDDRGIPTKATMERLNLGREASELEKFVKLS
jgi:aldehyde:ferredoxin oxidoreductase